MLSIPWSGVPACAGRPFQGPGRLWALFHTDRKSQGLYRPATSPLSLGVYAFAATTSTSTLNSSRVKPETIIRVEAGGGSATTASRAFM